MYYAFFSLASMHQPRPRTRLAAHSGVVDCRTVNTEGTRQWGSFLNTANSYPSQPQKHRSCPEGTPVIHRATTPVRPFDGISHFRPDFCSNPISHTIVAYANGPAAFDLSEELGESQLGITSSSDAIAPVGD
jgi:hypothetical protein